MYTVTNFKTKKAMKEAVQNYNERPRFKKRMVEQADAEPQLKLVYDPEGYPPVEVFEPGIQTNFRDGIVSIEGPHYPEAHKWYAQVEIKNRLSVRV